MAWSASKVFGQFVADAFNRTAAFDLDADTFKVALFDNSITPNSTTTTSGDTAYGAGVWASGGVPDTSGNNNWVAAGRALASITSSHSAGTYTFDAADLAGGGTVTITNAYGCLVYDDTLATPVADQGVCFNYFGGPQTVSAGTFTIVWSTSGIFTVTV